MPVKLGKTGAPLSVVERIHLIQGCEGLGGSPRHLLLTLGVLHNEEMGYAFASVEYLAFRLGVDKATITRALSVLVNEEGLVVRSLRDGDWTTSRQTEILWHKLHARRVKFVPKKKKGRVAKESATIEEDLTVVDTLDEPAPQPAASLHRSQLEVAQETMALLKMHFSDHLTFQDKGSERMVYDCIWGCIEKVGSAERCLAIYEWVCTDPSNEDKRDKLKKSKKLGGYFKSCFDGWSRSFIEADKANLPTYERSLTNLCNGTNDLYFSEEHMAVLQPFRAWLEAKLGDNLLNIEVLVDKDGTYLRVEIAEEFKAARVVSELEDSDNEIS